MQRQEQLRCCTSCTRTARLGTVAAQVHGWAAGLATEWVGACSRYLNTWPNGVLLLLGIGQEAWAHNAGQVNGGLTSGGSTSRGLPDLMPAYGAYCALWEITHVRHVWVAE